MHNKPMDVNLLPALAGGLQGGIAMNDAQRMVSQLQESQGGRRRSMSTGTLTAKQKAIRNKKRCQQKKSRRANRPKK